MTYIPRFADDLILYCGADGRDTCQGISDDQLCEALLEEPILLDAAKWLSQKIGRIVTRDSIAARINASPRLQSVRLQSQHDHEKRMITLGLQKIAKNRIAKRTRDHGPRCGAKARSGRPCQRKVALDRPRCPNHGGLSTGPRTSEGKSRISAAQQKRWARHRQK